MIERIKILLSYFDYHNKNLTKEQSEKLNELKDEITHLISLVNVKRQELERINADYEDSEIDKILDDFDLFLDKGYKG